MPELFGARRGRGKGRKPNAEWVFRSLLKLIDSSIELEGRRVSTIQKVFSSLLISEHQDQVIATKSEASAGTQRLHPSISSINQNRFRAEQQLQQWKNSRGKFSRAAQPEKAQVRSSGKKFNSGIERYWVNVLSGLLLSMSEETKATEWMLQFYSLPFLPPFKASVVVVLAFSGTTKELEKRAEQTNRNRRNTCPSRGFCLKHKPETIYSWSRVNVQPHHTCALDRATTRTGWIMILTPTPVHLPEHDNLPRGTVVTILIACCRPVASALASFRSRFS